MNFKTWMEQMPMSPPMGDPMADPMGGGMPDPSMTQPMAGPQPPTNPPQQKTNPLQEKGELERIFRQAKQRLTGGLKTDPTIALSKLEGGPKGAADALKFVFNHFKDMGSPWSQQAEDARNWLVKLGNNEIQTSAAATVGHLLAKLFGAKLYERVMKQPAPSSDATDPIEKPEIPDPPNQQQQAAENQPELAHVNWSLPIFREWKK